MSNFDVKLCINVTLIRLSMLFQRYQLQSHHQDDFRYFGANMAWQIKLIVQQQQQQKCDKLEKVFLSQLTSVTLGKVNSENIELDRFISI